MSTDSQVNLGSLGQVSMLCRSAEVTEAWYRDVLRLPHVFTFGELVFFDCGGTRLYFNQVSDEKWRKGSILYFLVPDINVAEADLKGRGIRFQTSPNLVFKDADTGVEEWMTFFNDPDGNTLALMSRVAPAA